VLYEGVILENNNSWWHKFLFNEQKQRKFIILLSAAISLMILFLSLSNRNFIKSLDYHLYDFYVKTVQDVNTSDVITVVNIDDKSMQALGQWPWPRFRVAKLLLELRNAGAASIGLDIIFSENDRTSPNNYIKSYHDEFGLDIKLDGMPDALNNNDMILSQVLSDGPFVLGNFAYLYEKPSDRECLLIPLETAGDINILTEVKEGTGFMCNIPEISKAVQAKGFFNAFKDSDGTMRKLPLVIKYNGKLYPSLSLATFQNISASNKVKIDEDFHGPFLQVWDKKIRVDKGGNVLFNVKGNGGYYNYLSAIDIMTNNYNLNDIRGKFVVIGSTAVGLNDYHKVAGNEFFPGVELHGTFVDNLLNNDFFFIPVWSGYAEIFIMFSVSLLAGYMISRKKAAAYLSVLVGSYVFLFVGAYLVINTIHMYISPASSLVSLTTVAVVSLFSINLFETHKSLKWAEILNKTHEATIGSMATVAETRDPETGAHIIRTQYYVKALAENMSKKNKYKKVLTKDFIELLFKSAPMHDIGKVGVSDSILLKPGKLTDEEFELMKLHTVYGLKMINDAQEKIPENAFLTTAADIAYSHHEKWNGRGYPQGLEGEDIPLSGRLMAVADVYDALISKRHYKAGMPHEKAKSIIVADSGTHFDPDVVDAFVEIEDEFVAIAEEYGDPVEEST